MELELSKLPLLLHALLELAAALSFTLNPAAQLSLATTSEDARLILRSYGGLLLSTSLLCGGFYLRAGFDAATRLVAACMAVYHLFPINRALVRVSRGRAKEGRALGGPAVHLAVHLVALLGLAWSAVYGRDGL